MGQWELPSLEKLDEGNPRQGVSKFVVRAWEDRKVHDQDAQVKVWESSLGE